MKDFFLGCHYLITGFRLLLKPQFRRYIILPLMINIGLFIGLFITFIFGIQHFNAWLLSQLPDWLQWLGIFIWILFLLAFFGFALFTFMIFANLLAAPFNSLLSEQVETYLLNYSLIKRSLIDDIKETPRVVKRQIDIIFYYVPRALGVFILFFIPIIQLFATLIAFLFHAWIMAMTYIDYPADNHRTNIRAMRHWLQVRGLQSLGFGCGVLLLSLIPGLNFFIMPAAVIGATKWWIEENKST